MSVSARDVGAVCAAGSSQPSNHDATWRVLERRRINAVFTELSHRFEEEGPSSAFVALLSECFKTPINGDDDEAVKNDAADKLMKIAHPAIKVMDALHLSEEAFSLQLFEAVVSCFENGGWIVRRSPHRKRRVAQHVRGSDDDGAGEREIFEFVFDDMILVGRRDDPRYVKLTFSEVPTKGESDRLEVVPRSDNKYVCYVGDVKYAMGLSRKAKMIEDESKLSVNKGDSFPDHSWAIFKKEVQFSRGPSGTQLDCDAKHEGKGWTVHRVVAAVELKMETSSNKILDLMSSTKRQADGSQKAIVGVKPLGAVSRFGPVAQELAYVIGHVLPGRAALGLDLPTSVPFAVLAGRRSNEKRDNVLHWLHGNVITPDECGETFNFDVDSFDQFRKGNGSHALSAYLDVLVNGLVAAEDWLVAQAALSPAALPPKPLSGRTVKFGGTILNGFSLMYSPLTNGKSDRASGDQVGTIKVSQGEIFSGELDLSRLRRTVPNSDDVFWCKDTFAAGAIQQVLVKVVSLATYSQLVGQEGLLWNHDSMAFRSLLACLSPSLLAVYTTDGMIGLVQIMPNLQLEEFKALRPELCATSDTRRAMWTAFERLVRDTLIPLAKARVIHPDIRPGFDHTSNLLWNESTKKMRIVDMDSLVTFKRWICPKDKRYISREALTTRRKLRSAFDFLFCQLVVITDSWIGTIRESEADATEILESNQMIQSWSREEPWPECDASLIHLALGRIGEKFLASENAES